MFERKNPPAETLPEDRVQLKPLFGIRPGVYLTGLYGLILGSILFFLLLYPGLVNPGTVLAMTSEPSGAAVRVDDAYMGTTPCGVFIPQGTRRVELILPGFVPYQKDLDLQGQVFGSRIFPRKKPFHGILEETAPGAALLWGASDYAVWSFAGEPTATYQIPPRLSEGAYRSGGAEYGTLEKILQGAARFTSTKAGLRDLIRAKYTIDNGGLAVSPVSLVRSLEDILVYLSKNPETALWLKELLPGESASLLTNSRWYAQQSKGVSPPEEAPRFGSVVSLGLLTFREISGGTLIQRNPFPRAVGIPDFSMAETEVSVPAWEAFIQANPEWGPEHTETLITQGLVTSEYMAPAGILDSGAVSGVSWYAAQAYCQWLSGFLGEDYEVRLPTEAEWEYAAKAAGGPLRDMLGGLWEWCGDLYAPNPFLPADPEIILAIGSPERAVRGTSWVHRSSSVKEETRGSLFPASCSPFGSFRPVIAKKNPRIFAD